MGTNVRRVKAAAYSGFEASIHPQGPKLTVRCGHCLATFSKRPGVPGPVVLVCPHCRTVNTTSLVW